MKVQKSASIASVVFWFAFAVCACSRLEGRSPDQAPEGALNPEPNGTNRESLPNQLEPLSASVQSECAIDVQVSEASDPSFGRGRLIVQGREDLGLENQQTLIRDPERVTHLRNEITLYATGIYTFAVEATGGESCWSGLEVNSEEQSKDLNVEVQGFRK